MGSRWSGVGLLAVSAAALVTAPFVLDASYSVVANTTSESGAQGVDGAWVARSGFLLFGLAVLWIAWRRSGTWGQPAAALHVTFGVCMCAVAAFSLRSWVPGTDFDPTEDLLHSIAATVLGFAFALGVVSVAIRNHSSRGPWIVLDSLAVIASVILPLGMTMNDRIDGALQRLMFALGYLWYAREAWPSRNETDPRPHREERTRR